MAARRPVRPASGGVYLGLVALVVFGVAAVLPETFGASAALIALAVAATLGALAITVMWIARQRGRLDSAAGDQITAFVTHDAAPSFLADLVGEIGFANKAAVLRHGVRTGQTLTRVLGEVFASPAPVIERLQNRALATGFSSEDIATRRGHVRLAVHRMGGDRFLWRLEDMVERAVGGRGAESISLPMLTVSKTGTVLFMNDALRRFLGERVKTLDRIFPNLPVVSGAETDVSTLEGTVRARVVEIEGPGGRREMYFLPSQPGASDIEVRDTTFDNLPVALLRLGRDGEILGANATAEGLIGKVGPGDRLSDRFEGLGRPVADWISDSSAGRTGADGEVLKARGGDRDIFLQVMLSRASFPGGDGLLAVLTDATQLKTLEAQFVQSQKMQAIGQLAGGVAHDFNNLLTAISGHCDLLLVRHGSSDPDYADLVQISQNANRAASLVGQLLAFSRKQTLTPSVIDLADTLSDLTHLLNRLVGERVRLVLKHDPGLRPIRADRRQLEQVIMNLVVNARDAMPAGGAIEITTSNEVLADPLVRDRARVPAGDYVVVRVSDQGVGIAPENVQKIFEPFYTTKRTGEGTGLGLSTVYGIMKQTGGFIFCDSAVGVGTTFSLYFRAREFVDLAAANVQPVSATPPRRAMQPGEGVVLLVEDETPVRTFASRALRMRGFTVIEAQNAEEALNLLADPDLSVDVFVTDVIMPGKDGPTWVREALQDRPGTRVVFVSGYAEDSFGEARTEIPNSTFLPKPFSLSELTATVQRQLH
jgi:two-component system cell cycle sensor histidine kinase/response regulator CckA